MRAARRWVAALVVIALALSVLPVATARGGQGQVTAELPTPIAGDAELDARDGRIFVDEGPLSATLSGGRIEMTVHTVTQRYEVVPNDHLQMVDTDHDTRTWDLTGSQLTIEGAYAEMVVDAAEDFHVRSDDPIVPADEIDWADRTASFSAFPVKHVQPRMMQDAQGTYDAWLPAGTFGVSADEPTIDVHGAMSLYTFDSTIHFRTDDTVRQVHTGFAVDSEGARARSDHAIEDSPASDADDRVPRVPGAPAPAGPGLPDGSEADVGDFFVFRTVYATIDARPDAETVPYLDLRSRETAHVQADTMTLDLQGTVWLRNAEGSLAVQDETYTFDGQDVLISGDLTITPRSDGASDGHQSYRVQGDVSYLKIGDATHDLAEENMMAIVIGLALGAGVLVYAWPLLKLTVFNVLGAPLYTRLAKDKVLTHDVRGKIYEIIENDPGISISSIADRADVGWGTAVYHLGVLEDSDLVVAMRDGRYKRYYQNGGRYNGKKETLAAIRNDTTRNVVSAVLENPGITQTGVCDEVGISAPLAHWHLDRLQEAEVVQQERDGRYKRHYVSEGAKETLMAHLA